MPVGLILNELISNSLKHGFPGERRGTITVDLKDNKEIGFQLTVRDNGIGLPPNFALENTPSLGLRLVKILNNQIGAQFEFKNENGAEFQLTFREVKV